MLNDSAKSKLSSANFQQQKIGVIKKLFSVAKVTFFPCFILTFFGGEGILSQGEK
jgi:hypothetical protein